MIAISRKERGIYAEDCHIQLEWKWEGALQKYIGQCQVAGKPVCCVLQGAGAEPTYPASGRGNLGPRL
jgi:hypothetical protein